MLFYRSPANTAGAAGPSLRTIRTLTLVALLAAGPLMRLVGPKIEGMVTRLLGVILAALAVQFVLDGIEATLIAELATS